MMSTRFGVIRTIVSVGAFSALLTSLPAISETVQTTTEYVITAAFERLEQEFYNAINQTGTTTLDELFSFEGVDGGNGNPLSLLGTSFDK